MSSDAPGDRRYTNDHEWAKIAGNEVTVGITAFAVEQLGDVTLVNIDAKPGDTLKAGTSFGTIESVKTLSDLLAPVDGKLLRVNDELTTKPERVNEDCYGAGWMVVIESHGPAADLMDDKAYAEFLRATAH